MLVHGVSDDKKKMFLLLCIQTARQLLKPGWHYDDKTQAEHNDRDVKTHLSHMSNLVVSN